MNWPRCHHHEYEVQPVTESHDNTSQIVHSSAVFNGYFNTLMMWLCWKGTHCPSVFSLSDSVSTFSYVTEWTVVVILWSDLTAAAGPAVSGLLPVSGVPLEVPPPDPPHVRLLRHARLVRPVSRARPRLLLHTDPIRRQRHLGGLLWHPAHGESVLHRLHLHPPGLPGHAVCGLLGGVLALLLQDGDAGSCRIPSMCEKQFNIEFKLRESTI